MEEKQDLYSQRLEKLARIRETGQEPFKYSYPRTHTVQEALEAYEALVAGTRNAGAFLETHVAGAEPVGTIAVGQRADLILLDGNPLEDVTHVKRRVGVMVRGRWFPQSELQAKLDVLAQKYAKVNIEPEAKSPATNGG